MSESQFFEDVWAVVRMVPRGRITTYGAIAKYLGATKSSRMVGWAMNASHFRTDVPAHRVVNRNGLLTGKNHFESADSMALLLNAEGILVVNDCVVDFKKHFWDPEDQL